MDLCNIWPWFKANGIPFWDRCTTHFRAYSMGVGMFTGGTGILTHGHMGGLIFVECTLLGLLSREKPTKRGKPWETPAVLGVPPRPRKMNEALIQLELASPEQTKRPPRKGGCRHSNGGPPALEQCVAQMPSGYPEQKASANDYLFGSI